MTFYPLTNVLSTGDGNPGYVDKDGQDRQMDKVSNVQVPYKTSTPFTNKKSCQVKNQQFGNLRILTETEVSFGFDLY